MSNNQSLSKISDNVQWIRAFRISYLSPTDTQGGRVKIFDTQKSKSIIFSFWEYKNFDSIADMAGQYLQELGIKISAAVSLEGGNYILLSEDLKTQIK